MQKFNWGECGPLTIGIALWCVFTERMQHCSKWTRTCGSIWMYIIKINIHSNFVLYELQFSEHLLLLFKSVWRTFVLYVGPLIPLFWTSGGFCPGPQSQRGSLTRMLHHLHAMDSLDSSLLTAWWPAWQPSCLIHILAHVYRHWWGSNPGSQVNTYDVKCLECVLLQNY